MIVELALPPKEILAVKSLQDLPISGLMAHVKIAPDPQHNVTQEWDLSFYQGIWFGFNHSSV